MWNQQSSNDYGARLRYKIGDVVDIVAGVDQGRKGEIVDIFPTHTRPYVVKINDSWYVHYPEDRLAPTRRVSTPMPG